MAWLESTALAEWVRTSLVGYPFVLTVHSVGMAIMVGLVTVINLRLVGRFERIPYASLAGLLTLAWYGLAINAISGAAILVFPSFAPSFARRRSISRSTVSSTTTLRAVCVAGLKEPAAMDPNTVNANPLAPANACTFSAYFRMGSRIDARIWSNPPIAAVIVCFLHAIRSLSKELSQTTCEILD